MIKFYLFYFILFINPKNKIKFYYKENFEHLTNKKKSGHISEIVVKINHKHKTFLKRLYGSQRVKSVL